MVNLIFYKKPASFQTQAPYYLTFKKFMLLALNFESREQSLSEYDMRRIRQSHQ